MYTLAELEAIDLNTENLTLSQRIEVSTSVRAYLGEYSLHSINSPAWLRSLRDNIAQFLREDREEQEITVFDAAKERKRNRLPFEERRQAIQAEIAVLEEELRQL